MEQWVQGVEGKQDRLMMMVEMSWLKRAMDGYVLEVLRISVLNSVLTTRGLGGRGDS